MTVVEKPIREIRPYERNPRRNDNAVDAVAESIREFGWRVPIIIDGNGVIVAGHTRYKAAQKLKMKSVPCVVANDLSDEQIKAFRIADNSTGNLATWDMPALKLELDDLEFDMGDFGLNIDFSLPGYPESERNDLTPYRPPQETQTNRNEPPVTVEDDYEPEPPRIEAQEDDYEQEPPAEPKARYGDIFQLGRHRLMCGDATSKQSVITLMGGGAR